MSARAFIAIACALGAAACSPPDYCGDLGVSGMSCLTVEVQGQLDPGVSQVDSLQVDVRFYANQGYLYRATVASTADGGGPSGLPVAFPVVLPVGTQTDSYIYNSVTVLARMNGLPVGLGHATFRFAVNSHAGVKVSLKPTSADGCFDHVHDFNESDVDCGGDTCPACDDGRACNSGETDCAYHVCGGYPEVCGGVS